MNTYHSKWPFLVLVEVRSLLLFSFGYQYRISLSAWQVWDRSGLPGV